MTFFFTGEGPTDYGRQAFGSETWQEGAAMYIFRKTAASLGLEHVDIVPIDKKSYAQVHLQRLPHTIKGRGQTCYKFLMYLQLHKSHTSDEKQQPAVFYCDIDKLPGAKNASETVCKRHYQDETEHINAAIKCFARPCIAMMPLKMIENWLLSDKAAFQKAFDTTACPALPPKPELIWGDDEEPISNYPKHFMDRVLAPLLHCNCKQGEVSGHTELFVDIAQNTDIQTLKEKCPISFVPFYDSLKQLLGDISHD